MITVTRKYHFESAHWLPGVPEGHKCRRCHGHNYEVEFTFTGDVDRWTGMLIDFFDIDKVIDPKIAWLDHQVLNDLPGLSNPTVENISRYLLDVVRQFSSLPKCTNVRVYETKNCWADATPEV